jgi:D-amino-acid dehydrogenase
LTKRIVIVGGGVIGCCIAYYASRDHQVTILERGTADDRGCSFGNAGLVVPSHFVPLAAPGMMARALKWMWNSESPFYVKPRIDRALLSWGWKFHRAATAQRVAQAAPLLSRLQLESRELFEALAAERDFGFVARGVLMLCQSQHALEEEARIAEQAPALGMPAEIVGAKEIAELEPELALRVAGGVLYPRDAHLDPSRLMSALRELLRERNVELSWNHEVTGWRHRHDSIEAVRTTRGDISGDEYVVCAGSWTSAMLRPLGVALPMEAGKGYSITLSNPPAQPRHPFILMEARVAVTPMGMALRFGGTMEIAGLDETINPSRIRGITKSVPKYLPDFSADDFRDATPWCGLRPCSPDGLPYVGRLERYHNLSVAAGHGMLGVSLGPITGRLVSEILAGAPSIAIDLLSPDRFMV